MDEKKNYKRCKKKFLAVIALIPHLGVILEVFSAHIIFLLVVFWWLQQKSADFDTQ